LGALPIADIGPETIANYSRILKDARLSVFHGPAGVFELEKFRLGTEELLHAATKGLTLNNLFNFSLF
jgi:phosphoglycerate kinase